MKLAEKLNSKNRKLSIIEICDSLESQGHIDSRTSSKIIRSAKISKNHPLIVIERLKELKDLISIKFKVIKIMKVKDEYNIKILLVCLIISELLNEKKLVNDFFKLSS